MKTSTSISISAEAKEKFDRYYNRLEKPRPTRAELLGWIVEKFLKEAEEDDQS